jgi:Sec-independent protein secretion pathway component TatC
MMGQGKPSNALRAKGVEKEEEEFRQNIILIRAVLTINFTAYSFWTIFPFILWCIQSETESQNSGHSEINNNYDEGQWKYFCYRLWLPQNTTQTPM